MTFPAVASQWDWARMMSPEASTPAFTMLAERTLQAVPTQMVATDWLRLPPVGGSVTVGVGPEVTVIVATFTLTLSAKAEPLTVPSAHAGVAVARASPARARRLTPR